MYAFISTLSRDLICATAAILISMVVGASFVQSTATAAVGHAPVAVAAVTSV